jgi:hypothetical protein
MQDKRNVEVTFEDLPLIYLPGTLIYLAEAGGLQAFVIVEVGGMTPRPYGFDPLHLRAWSIDHSGRTFTKKYHEFDIPFFSGKRHVSTLRYIPTGHLQDENKQRQCLISRGRKYWDLASKVCVMGHLGKAVSGKSCSLSLH